VLARLAAVVGGGDALRVMRPTSATASLNLRRMMRNRHPRALHPTRYAPR
jgi:hypothetical protein